MNKRLYAGLNSPPKTYATIGRANHAACEVRLPAKNGNVANLDYLVVPVEDQNRWAVVFIVPATESHLAGDIAKLGHGVA